MCFGNGFVDDSFEGYARFVVKELYKFRLIMDVIRRMI
jgi:hypothetical protein